MMRDVVAVTDDVIIANEAALIVAFRSRPFIVSWLLLCCCGIAGTPLHADELNINNALHMGSWSPFASQWDSVSRVCASSDGSSEFYHVTASSLSASADFELINEIGDSVAYSVYWRNDVASAPWQQLIFDVSSTLPYAYADSAQCIGGPSAEIRVEVDKAEIDAAMPGVYSDTLLLTLSPL